MGHEGTWENDEGKGGECVTSNDLYCVLNYLSAGKGRGNMHWFGFAFWV